MAKNKALGDAGAFVPKSFDELGEIIKSVQSLLFQIIILIQLFPDELGSILL